MDKDSINSDLIRKLAEVLNDTGLTEIEIAEGESRIRIARTLVQAPQSVVLPAAAAPAPQAASAPTAPVADTVTPQTPGAVCSPMVGNVYLSPKPGAPAFIREGDTVKEGQTLLIVEAMKVMNPITAPRAGVVKRLLVKDAQPVEYNEVMLVLE